MRSDEASVQAYLASLPEERRTALEAIRRVILENLDEGYEEGVQYGMIGYYVPHRVYSAGYHCDPKQPLPYVGLASQKGHMSLNLMCLYMDPEGDAWFRTAWTEAGKKLDMGKACVRFKRLEDVPLDVVGELIRRTPAEAFIAHYEAQLGARGSSATKTAKKASTKKPAKKAGSKRVAKKTARKTAKKAGASAAAKPAKKAASRASKKAATRGRAARG